MLRVCQHPMKVKTNRRRRLTVCSCFSFARATRTATAEPPKRPRVEGGFLRWPRSSKWWLPPELHPGLKPEDTTTMTPPLSREVAGDLLPLYVFLFSNFLSFLSFLFLSKLFFLSSNFFFSNFFLFFPKVSFFILYLHLCLCLRSHLCLCLRLRLCLLLHWYLCLFWFSFLLFLFVFLLFSLSSVLFLSLCLFYLYLTLKCIDTFSLTFRGLYHNQFTLPFSNPVRQALNCPTRDLVSQRTLSHRDQAESCMFSDIPLSCFFSLYYISLSIPIYVMVFHISHTR